MVGQRKSFESFENPYSTQVTTAEHFPRAQKPARAEEGAHEDCHTSQTQTVCATQLCGSSSVPTVKARLVNMIDGTIYEMSDSNPELTIGRHPNSVVVVSDVNVSARHLNIFRDN